MKNIYLLFLVIIMSGCKTMSRQDSGQVISASGGIIQNSIQNYQIMNLMGR